MLGDQVASVAAGAATEWLVCALQCSVWGPRSAH